MKKRIGRYQIEQALDTTGPFPASLAFDRESGRNVALELIPDLGSDEGEREQFRQVNLRKALHASRLRHPHIAQVYGVVEDQEGIWVAREPLKGESLENLLCTDSGISKALISHILYDTAACLDHAHRTGACHGRLTPAELLVQEDGALKILGFWRPCLASTSAVSAFEKTHYSAPEQIRGLDADPASDQYSLASIAHELLTGNTPFQGDAIAVRNRIMLDAPPDPSTFNPSVGPDACQVLLRALAKGPGERFSSCTEFVESLDQALETPPVWVLPEEYHGHSGPDSQNEPTRLEGDITESLLKEVLLEQAGGKAGSNGFSKYARVGVLALVAILAVFLTTTWVVNSAQQRAPAPGLALASATPPPAVLNQPYTFALQASGGRPPYKWAVVDGQLPEGLSLEPEGIIRGQTNETGTYDVKVQVKAADSEAAAEQQISLTVRIGPKIKSGGELTNGWLGRDYSHPLGVEGGQRPYRWAVTSGSIPPGLTLNTFSGFLGGRPEAAGTFRFEVSVTDLFGATSTRPFELTVKPVAEAVEKTERVVQAAASNSPPDSREGSR